MHHVYHYLGMFVFWLTASFAAGCAVMALVESRKRASIPAGDGGVILDPFTEGQAHAIVLRHRAGVGDE